MTHLISSVSPRLSPSKLKEEVKQFEAVAANLQAQIEEAGRKASHLERQLAERGAACRELENLRAVTHSQEQRVAQSQKEAQQSQTELASLEAVLALLHLREVERPLWHLCSHAVLLNYPRRLHQGCAA